MAPKGMPPASQHSWSSSEESPGSILHESVRGISLEGKKMDRQADSGEFNDEFSKLVRKGSNGAALYAVLALSVIISLVSFMIMYEYEPPLQQDGATDLNLWSDVCTAHRRDTVWADLLTEQIEILQNLIHASLLGGASLVAAYRGDVVWLFFVRNCLFYFGLASFSFLVVDGALGNMNSWRFTFALLFCIFASIGFAKIESTCMALRKVQLRLFEVYMRPSSSLKESVDRDYRILPSYQAQSTFEQSRANLIFQSAIVVQIISAVYVACTTIMALVPLHCGESPETTNPHRTMEGVVPDHDVMSSTSLSSFQMGYSLGAHEAFLLALFMLASTYPRCPASVGGALMSSLWRLLIACCSLISLLTTYGTVNLRFVMSFCFTLLEGMSMVPILYASWQLTVESGAFRTLFGQASGTFTSGNTNGKSTTAYALVAASDIDEEMCDETEMDCRGDCCVEGDRLCAQRRDDSCIHHPVVPTLRLIAASSRFSIRQRFGALQLWISSLFLLVGMTAENMVLLLTTPIGAHSTHEVYKWGMHLCAMFAFCVIMIVSSPTVYTQTRRLICFACPAGSVIAIWQLRELVVGTPDMNDDPIALLVACLFVWRAVSGIGQCIGLLALDTIEPKTVSLERMDIATNDTVASNDTMLRDAISRGRFALLKLFLPAFVAYTVTSALFSNCSEPMISPTVPYDCGGMNMFMLVPNWPGLGLFFHFGGLLAIFASDGLTMSTPSYPPSILIGALFALHASVLIAAHVGMELILHPNVRELVEYFGWQDWLRRITLVGWMVSSFYLFLCLNRVWKLKQPANF